MSDPFRFLAVYPDGRVAVSNDPLEIRTKAEEFSAEHFEPVHLYQHIMTVEAVRE
jgi:hypothetical protein